MKLLGIGDTFDGGVVISITKHGVVTRCGKYERLYPLSSVMTVLMWAQSKAA